MIFIDTNIVIEYLKDKQYLDKYCFDDLFINDIVVMELYWTLDNADYLLNKADSPH